MGGGGGGGAAPAAGAAAAAPAAGGEEKKKKEEKEEEADLGGGMDMFGVSLNSYCRGVRCGFVLVWVWGLVEYLK